MKKVKQLIAKQHTITISEPQRFLLMKVLTGTNLNDLLEDDLRELIRLIVKIGCADLTK